MHLILPPQPFVVSVSLSQTHTFSKVRAESIHLLKGLGIEGDAHCGETVKHRSRVAHNPLQPNFRQVHLVHAELFDELAAIGFDIAPGDIGENITTRGLDLLSLPVDTELQIGASARVRLTGLRNPCKQLDDFQDGLTQAVLERAVDGSLIRKAGVMGVVVEGGQVMPGDFITVRLPEQPHQALERI